MRNARLFFAPPSRGCRPLCRERTLQRAGTPFADRQTKGRKRAEERRAWRKGPERLGRQCGESARGVRRPGAPWAPGAAGPCRTVRRVARSGQENLCNRGEHQVPVSRGVPGRLPARPPHFHCLIVISSSSARVEAVKPPPRPGPRSALPPRCPPAPGRRRCTDLLGSP